MDFPVEKSVGTEMWSCTISHLPLILRKPLVARTHMSDFCPFLNVPLIRSRA